MKESHSIFGIPLSNLSDSGKGPDWFSTIESINMKESNIIDIGRWHCIYLEDLNYTNIYFDNQFINVFDGKMDRNGLLCYIQGWEDCRQKLLQESVSFFEKKQEMSF